MRNSGQTIEMSLSGLLYHKDHKQLQNFVEILFLNYAYVGLEISKITSNYFYQ